jgi:hypothetical protein
VKGFSAGLFEPPKSLEFGRGYITYKRLFRLALAAPGHAASDPQNEK